MPKKKSGGPQELPPIVLEDSILVSPESLMQGIEYVRRLRSAKQSYESEALARGQELSGSGTEATTARTLGDKALGAIETLGQIFELPTDAVKWSEVIDRAVLKPDDL
jgi:hypothetical protein